MKTANSLQKAFQAQSLEENLPKCSKHNNSPQLICLDEECLMKKAICLCNKCKIGHLHRNIVISQLFNDEVVDILQEELKKAEDERYYTRLQCTYQIDGYYDKLQKYILQLLEDCRASVMKRIEKNLNLKEFKNIVKNLIRVGQMMGIRRSVLKIMSDLMIKLREKQPRQ